MMNNPLRKENEESFQSNVQSIVRTSRHGQHLEGKRRNLWKFDESNRIGVGFESFLDHLVHEEC